MKIIPTAIVTDVRYRMAVSIIRELAIAGVRVTAVEFKDGEMPLGFYSKYVSETFLLDKENYEQELYKLCQSIETQYKCKPAIVPVGANTLKMLCDIETNLKFSAVAGFCVPDSYSLAIMNDKGEMQKLAASVGIPIPKEYKSDLDEKKFPCVVKPVFGEKYGLKAKERYRVVSSEDELKDAKLNFKKLCQGDKILVQQYINGPGYGCSVFALNGKVISNIMHKRIREYPASGGPSAACETVNIPEILDYASRLVKAQSFTGICMFEFKEMDGVYYFLESNPRVWGSYPLTKISNSNLTLKYFENSFNKANYNCDCVSPAKKAKYARMHYLLTDMAAAIDYARSGRPIEILNFIKDCINPKVKGGLLDFKDLKPSIMYLKGKLKK